MPEIYRQLMTLHNRLESHYHEVQDFEFTIERAFSIACKRARQNERARDVRTSVEMFNEGLISKERALLPHRTGNTGTITGSAIGAKLSR